MELSVVSLLRIYLSEDDSAGEAPLYDAILRKAHEARLGGATVLRGIAGYGPASLAVKFFQFRTEARPVVIEIVEEEEKIAGFLPVVESLLESGAVTIERVRFAAVKPAP